jgi:nitroreductase
MIRTPEQKIVDEAITSRRSIRAFLPKPVAHEDIQELLSVAARAPSGSNTQPWKVYVLTGATRQRLSDEIMATYLDPAKVSEHKEEYNYYPLKWVAPYVDRRRKVGWDLYALLGLTRENKSGMQAQHGRNYQFFDAPVGLIFTTHTVMEQGSYLDYGMFVQTVMIAAKARGLDTCPQAALNPFHQIIHAELGMGENETMVCAMSMGYANPEAPENQLRTERAPVEEWVKFVG